MALEDLIRSGDVAAAVDAVRGGANIDARDGEGFTPLLRAAALGQHSLVDALLEAGADPLAAEPRMGATALHLSTQSGEERVTRQLLDAGAFIDQQSPVLGNTALMDAILYRSPRVARLLLDRGARTSSRNHWHQSALDIARDEDAGDIAAWIEQRDAADARDRERVELPRLADTGEIDRVRDLVERGAPVDERTPFTGLVDDDYTALGIAARDGLVELVTALLAAGADPRARVGLMGGTALHEAAFFGHADVIRVLTAEHPSPTGARVDVDARGAYNGMTALHDAVWHAHGEAVRALVEAGVRTDVRSHSGLTARELARRYGYGDIATYLEGVDRA